MERLIDIGRRASVVILVTVVTATVAGMIFWRHALDKVVGVQTKLVAQYQCTDEYTAMAHKGNPNKVLFISCGGFLE